MPANSTHPDYDANATSWLRARDVIAGEDAVKAAGEKYLPKLDSQSSDEYLAYKTRASFFNAAARTADGRWCGFDLVMLEMGGGNHGSKAALAQIR